MPIDFDCSIESCSSSSPQTYSCQSMSQLFGPSKKPSSVTIFHMMSFLIVKIRPPPSHLRELLFKASQGNVDTGVVGGTKEPNGSRTRRSRRAVDTTPGCAPTLRFLSFSVRTRAGSSSNGFRQPRPGDAPQLHEPS